MSFDADEIQAIVRCRWFGSPTIHRHDETADRLLGLFGLNIHLDFSCGDKFAFVVCVKQFDFRSFNRQICFGIDRDPSSLKGFNVPFLLSPLFEFRILRWLDRNCFDGDRRIGANVDNVVGCRAVAGNNVILQGLLNAGAAG